MLKYCKHLAAAFVACLVLVLLAQPAEAAGGQQGAFTYELKGNGTAVITGYDWNQMSGQDIYIPRMLDGYTVTGIGDEAFANIQYLDIGFPDAWRWCTRIKVGNLVIPDTVTSIGDRAFWGIEFGTQQIRIPSSVIQIGSGAFSNCPTIMEFVVESGNPIYTTIDGVLFNKREKMLVTYPLAKSMDRHYSIPEGIVSIDDYAFFAYGIVAMGSSVYSHRSAVNRVYLPDTLTSIGAYAFAFANIVTNADELVQICLPASISDLGTGAFAYSFFCLGNWSKIHIDLSQTSITQIPSLAFYHLGGFEQELTISWPENVVEIGEYSFANGAATSYLYHITIPASVQVIRTGAFFSHDKLIDCSFAESSQLVTIEDRVFLGCTSLSALKIPASVTSIGEKFCNRSRVFLEVETGSYAEFWASEHGYMIKNTEEEDTDWLN